MLLFASNATKTSICESSPQARLVVSLHKHSARASKGSNVLEIVRSDVLGPPQSFRMAPGAISRSLRCHFGALFDASRCFPSTHASISHVCMLWLCRCCCNLFVLRTHRISHNCEPRAQGQALNNTRVKHRDVRKHLLRNRIACRKDLRSPRKQSSDSRMHP